MIELQNLRKSFGDREILKGINLKISEGEIVFVLGTSGTGKSVLLKLLVGLLKATSGRIKIDEVDTTDFTEDQLFDVRKKCGMVFQHPALFDSLSVYENVAFGLRRLGSKESGQLTEDAIATRVKKSLDLVHLRGIEGKLPQAISYGMQKRVSLARTAAIEPQILLFDEPTTGLDPITTNAVNQLILEMSRTLKTTSIVVSHDMQCAIEIADRIVVLDKGEIIEQGTPQDIRKSQHPLVKDFMAEVNGMPA